MHRRAQLKIAGIGHIHQRKGRTIGCDLDGKCESAAGSASESCRAAAVGRQRRYREGVAGRGAVSATDVVSLAGGRSADPTGVEREVDLRRTDTASALPVEA